MNVVISKCSASFNRVDKTEFITDIISINCEMMNTDTLFPEIKLSSDYSDYNYIFVPSFNRYYFVNEVERLSGEHIIVKCKVDVLMTYKDDILNLKCNVVRNERERIGELLDDKLIYKVNHRITTKTFGEELGPLNYVLGTI